VRARCSYAAFVSPGIASPWISVRVRAEIDQHPPDDLAWSVAWRVTGRRCRRACATNTRVIV
jgi:hypothetical protein